MLENNFALFLLRHRFSPHDIFPSVSNDVTRHDFELLRHFGQRHTMGWQFGDGELAKLNRAFLVAEYVSMSETNHPEAFSKITSMLNDEAWRFAIGFAPFHKVHIAFENLERVQAAMVEACLSLNSAKAGMEAAIELQGADPSAYQREQSKATSSLLTFSALYASYIDVCYRIRDYSGLKKSGSYKRAVRKILGKNAGKHGFVKGLRNFILHYHLVEPQVTISIGEERSVTLWLNANSLLYSGFNWAQEARRFIQSAEKLDVADTMLSIISDVQRQINFHRKIVERRLPKEKFAYDTYLHERVRYKHLHNSVFDAGKIVKRPTTTVSRILGVDFTSMALESTMPDEEVKSILIAMANRHQNLSEATQKTVLGEIEDLVRSRPQYFNTGAYLFGR